jgi:two-component system cell cycle response regulator
MEREHILKSILQSDELPTLPHVASELITLAAREDTTVADIAALVSQDIALSAKILKVSNSSFYSFPQEIGSINQAVGILGMNAVRSLVLSFSFLSIKSSKDNNRFDFTFFWEKSLASAVAAKLILEHVQGANTEQIFVSGLLQNLGELVLAMTFPDEYNSVLEKVEENQDDILGAEEATFGLNHALVGTEVTKNWGFPDILVLPIQYHHDPKAYRGKNNSLSLTIRAVYLSDLLINILFSDTPEMYHKQFRKEAAQLLKLIPEQIEDILGRVHLVVKEAGTYFNLRMKPTNSVQEILQEANIRLSLINLDYDQMNKQLILAKMHLENMTSELENKNKILGNLANIDGLTGIYNHRFFQNALDKEISRSIRHETQLSILLIDIDHFKKFNDTYGHQIGDFILTKFSNTLKENIRKYDTLARYGGEEFVIILPETGPEDAIVTAKKLREIIASTTFKDTNEEYHVTASFGHACSTPALVDNFSKNELINHADLALYQAKENGRNRVETYVPKKKWFSL